jgi:hypothetical protein
MELGKVTDQPFWQRGGRSVASLLVGGFAAALTETLFDLMAEKIKSRKAARKQ